MAPDGTAVPVPDPVLTPGAVFPGITVATVCTPGYASSVRDVPSSERAQVFARYHEADVPNTYEVDHLISLELGGSNDITNLWPEPLAGPYGAHTKDGVENALHSAVCAGSMLLADAQHVIATAWWALLPGGRVAPTTQAPTAPPAGGQPTTVATPAPTAPPATSTVPVATAGSFCAVVGDAAVTRAGTPLVCATASKSGAPYTQPRWRAP
ncbi:MAG TPA: HNH endonuclease signature motif containing protein [Acidimicrobiales bacterium]|nr:HNH endonuclease signature motif containing protein [Acidimicrobiales bacterium]